MTARSNPRQFDFQYRIQQPRSRSNRNCRFRQRRRLPTLQSSFGNGVLAMCWARPEMAKFPRCIASAWAYSKNWVGYHPGCGVRRLVVSSPCNVARHQCHTLWSGFQKANQDPNCVDNHGVPSRFSRRGCTRCSARPATAICCSWIQFQRILHFRIPQFHLCVLVPYKGYGQIPYLEFNGTSNYNALQASLQRRFSKGLTFGAVYTWSKSLTTANSDQDTQDHVQCSYSITGRRGGIVRTYSRPTMSTISKCHQAFRWTEVAFLHHRQLRVERHHTIHDRDAS